MTGFENDQGQPQQGGYQPWTGDTPTYPAPQHQQPYGQPQYPQQYQAPYAQQYPPQYQQQYPPQYQQQQYPQQYQPYQSAPYGYGYPATQKSNGLGIAGFVCGLLGLVLFWFPILGLLLAVIGVILGGTGISAGRRDGSGTGLAIAGLVLGLVALIPGLFWLVFAVNA